MKRKLVFTLLLIAIVAFPIVANGASESSNEGVAWPTGPITAYVNAKPGGNMDVKMRIMAKYLEPILDTSFAINNLPGGGGAVELTQFLSEKPNSNAVAFNGDAALAIAPLFDTLQYTSDDFIIVAGTDTVEIGLFINASLGVNSLEELQEYAKGKIIKFSAAGVNSATYIMTKYLLNQLGIDSDIITDKGYPTALVNVASGTADVCLVALNMGAAYIEDGSIVPLCVYDDKDFSGYSELGYASVPALRTLGYDISWDNLAFLALRAGTDPAVVDIFANALDQVFSDPAFMKEFADAGYVQVADPSVEATQAEIDRKIAAAKMYLDSLR